MRATDVEVSQETPFTLATIPRTTLEALEGQGQPGMLWRVPFRSQLDGTLYAYSNCGPASLAMVLEAFGVAAPTDRLRSYVNGLSGNYRPEDGTSLGYLVEIAEANGLEELDLYAEGRYRQWAPETVREHLREGHPVITLVKYRSLPGNAASRAVTDHYIVITGLLGQSFIYNDAAFYDAAGYGRIISEEGLLKAWDRSLVPRLGVALAPGPDQDGLWLLADWTAGPLLSLASGEGREEEEMVNEPAAVAAAVAPSEAAPAPVWRWPVPRLGSARPTAVPAATRPATARATSPRPTPAATRPRPAIQARPRRQTVDLSVSPLALGALGLVCLGLYLYRTYRQ